MLGGHLGFKLVDSANFRYRKIKVGGLIVDSCRYSHAMGNSNGNIQAYWNAIDGIHGLQGGFIWDWADQVRYSEAL